MNNTKIIYLTDDNDSWIIISKHFYHSTEELIQTISIDKPTFHSTVKIMGKTIPIPRFQQAYGASYNFSGSTAAIPDVLQCKSFQLFSAQLFL